MICRAIARFDAACHTGTGLRPSIAGSAIFEVQRELNAYVQQVAATVRRARTQPQALRQFCRAQHRKAYETLMKY